MYKKFINAFHLLNILFQALYTLVLPVGIGALASYLLTEYASCPSWIWAVLLTLGVPMGLYSMVKYLLSATKGLERIEREQIEKEREEKDTAQRRARLSGRSSKNESDEKNDEQ